MIAEGRALLVENVGWRILVALSAATFLVSVAVAEPLGVIVAALLLLWFVVESHRRARRRSSDDNPVAGIPPE